MEAPPETYRFRMFVTYLQHNLLFAKPAASSIGKLLEVSGARIQSITPCGSSPALATPRDCQRYTRWMTLRQPSSHVIVKPDHIVWMYDRTTHDCQNWAADHEEQGYFRRCGTDHDLTLFWSMIPLALVKRTVLPLLSKLELRRVHRTRKVFANRSFDAIKSHKNRQSEAVVNNECEKTGASNRIFHWLWDVDTFIKLILTDSDRRKRQKLGLLNGPNDQSSARLAQPSRIV